MRYFRFKAITLSVLIVLSSVLVNSGLMNVAFAENVGVDEDKNKTICARPGNDTYSPVHYGTLQGDKDNGYYCTGAEREYEAKLTCPDGYTKRESGETSKKTKKYICTDSKYFTRPYQSAENLLKQAPKLSKITNNVNIIVKCMDEASKNTSRNTPLEKDRKKVNQDFFVGCLARETGEDSDEIKKALGDIDPLSATILTTPEEAAENGEERSCGTEIPGIGWILCGVLDAAVGVADFSWGLLEGLLHANPLKNDPKDTYYQTWKNIRDIANVILVIFFLLIIFSQITSVGISNYGIKKQIGRAHV